MEQKLTSSEGPGKHSETVPPRKLKGEVGDECEEVISLM